MITNTWFVSYGNFPKPWEKMGAGTNMKQFASKEAAIRFAKQQDQEGFQQITAETLPGVSQQEILTIEDIRNHEIT